MENRHFPIFINPEKRKVVIFGGGSIATRRIETLLNFDFQLLVVSPDITEKLKELIELIDNEKITYIKEFFHEKYMENAYMILGCTNNRQVNKEIGEAAKKRKLYVSVCDAKEECNFFFPAIALNDEVVTGITGSGNTHAITKRAAKKIREIIKGKAY